MKVEIKEGKMYVKSDYNAAFVAKARQMQGKWNSPCWVFPAENEETVRAALLECYGENGLPQATVTADLNLDEYEHRNAVCIGNVVIAERRYRDYSVQLADNVMVVAGGFPGRGGSRNNPAVDEYKGTILRVKDIPVALFEQIKDQAGVKLVEDGDDEKRRKLMAEKEALLKRLAEIEELLK